MKVKDLKAILETLPDDMPVALLDISTDSNTNVTYPITRGSIITKEFFLHPGGPVVGEALFMAFKNRLNPNPVQ